jgi:hypothetical protein
MFGLGKVNAKIRIGVIDIVFARVVPNRGRPYTLTMTGNRKVIEGRLTLQCIANEVPVYQILGV